MKDEQSQQVEQVFYTVKQFCKTFLAFREGGIRRQIFDEDKNGLKDCGAVIRSGRKVLINSTKYFEWLQSGGMNEI